MSMALPSEIAHSLLAIVDADEQLISEARQKNVNQAGLLLNIRAKPVDEDRFLEKDYWNYFLQELYEFLCTESPRYDRERRQLAKVDKTTSKLVVPAIAVAIGNTLGIAAGILTPFLALVLFAILKLTVNSWCELNAMELGKKLEEVKIDESK